MKNKTFISRMLVFTLALILTFTLIPPNLIAFAGAGGGAGGGFGGGGGSTAVTDNPINDEDIGLRFSLVSKDSSGETKVIPNIYGKYYLDVWDSAYFKESWYGAINSYGRYSPNPTDENIKRWSDATFDKTIGALISASGKGHVDMNIANHLNPGGASKNTFFTEGEGGLKINGDLFYNWFMEKVGTYDGEVQSRYYFFINALYYGKTHGINMNNTFLVVEPVLHIANPNENYQCLGTEYIASWYGYVEGNLVGNHREPGNAWTIRDRFSSLANNFQIKRTNYLDTEMEAAMKNVLGVSVPGQFTITGGHAIAYGDGSYMDNLGYTPITYNFSYRTQGYAMQIFWLKDMATGTPIDTFDIETNKPNVPYYPENPEDTPDVPNSGTKNIIKLYADLYKDPNADGYYTQIVDIKNGSSYAYVRQNVSDKVTITNEEQVNGYKISAWYTSNTNYTDDSLNNEQFRASNMIVQQTDIPDDGAVSLANLGGTRFKIKNYRAVAGYPSLGIDAGGQKYKIDSTTSTNATQYTSYKRKSGSVVSNYGTYNYSENPEPNGTVVTLGANENTIVILYTREMTHITTDSTDEDITIPDNPDDRIDQSGNLTIVKLYGVLNPSTYAIENEKSVVLKNTTRNVNIKNESGYNFAEWVFVTGGSSTGLTASDMGNPSYYFKLDFSFGEVGDGVKSIHLVSNKVNQINSTVNFNGIEQPRTADTPYGKVQLFKYANALESLRYPDSDTKILGRAECAPLSGDASTYEIHSLRRLYEIKQSDGTWKTAIGNTKYLNAASDVTITQNVQYKVHYGSSLANSYKDSVTTNNGTDKDRGQYGYVKSMKATNTISFYPYYTMQYELPSAYNGNLGKNGEVVHIGYSNNANQIYVIGEEKRYLNTYDYAEVSFYGHSVSSSKGTDVVNNVLNTTRNGRIEISSEQWSTHARANSLIGLDNCALPGGATLSITIPTNNRQTVHITSYSAYLPKGSAGYAQVNSQNDPNAFGSMPTNINDAAERHTKLVESVAAGFEGLNVEQYFTKNTSTEAYSNTKDNGNTYDKNNTVYNQISSDLGSNKNLYDLPNAYSVTDFSGKEDKYYYRPDGDVQFDTNKKPSAIKFNNYTLATGNNKDGDGNTGDFDTNYESSSPNANTKTTYYTFYMNRVGQVLCITSNTDSSAAMANFTGTPSGDGSVLVAEWSKTEPKHFTYTAGLSTDIKLAAENTGIVEELYKQLQEGTGSDKATPWSKADGQWYFEAFDGLTIAKFDTTLSVGFIDPYERTSVLDPEIIPNMANKGDILTSSVMSQIVTSNTSLMYGTANKIGEFCDTDGSKLGDIIMPDLRSFFISDIFFAPNITVQDLK